MYIMQREGVGMHFMQSRGAVERCKIRAKSS